MDAWSQSPVPVRVLAMQIVLGSSLALICGLLAGVEAAVAVLAGAGIAVVGNAYFALRIFLRRSSEPATLLRNFMVGEALKIVLIISLFLVAVHVFGARFGWVIAGFAVTVLAFLGALLWSDPLDKQVRETNNDGS